MSDQVDEDQVDDRDPTVIRLRQALDQASLDYSRYTDNVTALGSVLGAAHVERFAQSSVTTCLEQNGVQLPVNNAIVQAVIGALATGLLVGYQLATQDRDQLDHDLRG